MVQTPSTTGRGTLGRSYNSLSGQCRTGTLSDLMKSIEELETKCCSSRTLRFIGNRLDHLIRFIDRDSGAFDCMSLSVGGMGFNPVALIWAVLKALLEISH
jgi:hypothetical protein